MFPLRDQNPTRTFPFVNYLLIAANVAAYVYETWLIQGQGEAAVIAGYGLVASRLFADPLGEAFTILTSMFMHGGLAHIGGNLLFLHIFGDNVEDAVGHGRYLGFYLLAGLGAAAAQLFTGASTVPMVGASGAIAGVLGAYLVLYPRAPITVLNPVPILWLFGIFLSFPAWLVVGEFFLVNLLSGVSSLGGSRSSGGVAFFAHIGGFITGLLLVRPFRSGRHPRSSERWSGWQRPPRAPGRTRYEAFRDH